MPLFLHRKLFSSFPNRSSIRKHVCSQYLYTKTMVFSGLTLEHEQLLAYILKLYSISSSGTTPTAGESGSTWDSKVLGDVMTWCRLPFVPLFGFGLILRSSETNTCDFRKDLEFKKKIAHVVHFHGNAISCNLASVNGHFHPWRRFE